MKIHSTGRQLSSRIHVHRQFQTPSSLPDTSWVSLLAQESCAVRRDHLYSHQIFCPTRGQIFLLKVRKLTVRIQFLFLFHIILERLDSDNIHEEYDVVLIPSHALPCPFNTTKHPLKGRKLLRIGGLLPSKLYRLSPP